MDSDQQKDSEVDVELCHILVTENLYTYMAMYRLLINMEAVANMATMLTIVSYYCSVSFNLAVGCLFCSHFSSSSPQCGRVVHGQDMHSELEMYANRLAEAEQRQRAMSTPDLYVCLSFGFVKQWF